jgi:hypothetical protein
VNLARGNCIGVFKFFLFAAILVFPVASKAQRVVQGEFHLSQSVRWENSLLPAGGYVYYVDSERWPVVIRVEQAGGEFSGVFIPQAFLQPGKRGGEGLSLAVVGSARYVQSLRIRDLNGEFDFSVPSSDEDTQSPDEDQSQSGSLTSLRKSGYLTILNPNREKISGDEAERIYSRVCETVEKALKREIPVRPRVIVQLGARENVLRYPMGEIMLKKWDAYRFADGVVDLALRDVVPTDERVRLSNSAVREAATTVTVCELKACRN